MECVRNDVADLQRRLPDTGKPEVITKGLSSQFTTPAMTWLSGVATCARMLFFTNIGTFFLII